METPKRLSCEDRDNVTIDGTVKTICSRCGKEYTEYCSCPKCYNKYYSLAEKNIYGVNFDGFK